MLLSDPVPLLDTSAWPGYENIEILPRIYGAAWVRPIAADESGRSFVIAGHAAEVVESVTLDGKPTAFQWRNGLDPAGRPAAFVDLARRAPSGAKLAARVRGLSGDPAAIVGDLYPVPDLRDFAAWCRNEGLELSGALVEKTTVRAAVAEVLRQVGATWSAGLTGFARPFPPPADDPIHAEFGPRDIGRDWSAECGLDAVVSRLQVPFDFDASTGKFRQTLVLAAPGGIEAFGAREGEFSLPWVRTSRQAIAVATRHLKWRARPVWTLQFSTGPTFRGIQPGGLIIVRHPRLPAAGEFVVTDIDPGIGSGTAKVTAQTAAGLEPAVEVAGLGRAFERSESGLRVTYADGVATLVISDPDGAPIRDAVVTLGDQKSKTDRSGTARLKIARGTYPVSVEADGFAPMTMEITL